MKMVLTGLVLAVAASAHGQMLTGATLVKALQHGGYVLVMRHASSPLAVPTKANANADNTRDERQLDERGIATATEMGKAIRALKIPIGVVLSSPTYRALETIKFAELGKARTVPALGENSGSMRATSTTQAEWLRHRVTQFRKGTNTVMVTHAPNITAAFPADAVGVGDGEALVFGPDGKGGARLVARIKMEDWPKLRR
ncbi:MAG: histidine phosphatase family protein, partial [Bryocella sp.]